jgi:hypothetical protein
MANINDVITKSVSFMLQTGTTLAHSGPALTFHTVWRMREIFLSYSAWVPMKRI